MTRSDLRPVPMTRVAVVAPRSRRREALVELAASGSMEVDDVDVEASDTPARQLLHEAPGDVEALLSRSSVNLEDLRRRGRWDLVAGEAELEERSQDAIEHGPAAVLLGWIPQRQLPAVAARLANLGVSVTPLPRPRRIDPPTHLEGGALQRSIRPLVQTYAVVPYEDVDPSMFAAITYVLMFGMMFGDVGHGLVLAGTGLWLGRTTNPRVGRMQRLWPFPFAAGLSAAAFGLLYGEAFGPTGLVPTLWLAPLEEPVRLIMVAIGVGAALIGVSYVIGAVNRWREGGPKLALYAPTGIAGVAVFSGAATVAGGLASGRSALTTAGVLVAALGLLLTFVGLRAEAGTGGAAIGQATIELFDTVIRAFANVVSFGRLAAFGLTHAAIGFAVWEGTTALWGPGLRVLAAITVFVVGNAVAFALEALVVGVQALRLEYYELFSRIFVGEGRLFTPWHVPVIEDRP